MGKRMKAIQFLQVLKQGLTGLSILMAFFSLANEAWSTDRPTEACRTLWAAPSDDPLRPARVQTLREILQITDPVLPAESVEAMPLNRVKARLSKDQLRLLNPDFRWLNLPTVEALRHRGKEGIEAAGLSERFLSSVENNFLGGGLARVIPFDDPESNQFVLVFRLIELASGAQSLDPNFNYYKERVRPYAIWRGDFVTEHLERVWLYGDGRGTDVLAVYAIPAKLLEMDPTSMRDPEPYYVLSRPKMQAAGISNVGAFLIGVADVGAYVEEDNRWDGFLDPDGEPLNPQYVKVGPKTLSDPRVRWVSSEVLEGIAFRTQFE